MQLYKEKTLSLLNFTYLLLKTDQNIDQSSLIGKVSCSTNQKANHKLFVTYLGLK